MPMVRSNHMGVSQTNTFPEDLQKLDAVSKDETRKDLQRCRDDQEKTRQELKTLQEEVRDTKSQQATQLAALRQEDSDRRKEHETKLRDAESATERAANLQQELEAETNRANDLKGELERTQQKVVVLEEQLADSHKDVENLNTSFRQLTESARLSEELYKSCAGVAEAERDQTKQDYASLQRQHNQQGHDYGCLKVVHADTVKALQAKMREAELAVAQHNADQKEIEMYKQARSEALQFLYRSVMLRPDVFTDDQASSVLETTRRRLRDCKDAKDRIDSVHTAISDRLDVACVRLDRYEQTSSEQLETARSLISTRNRQISGLKKLVTTQESAHRTALQERKQLALALRDTSARYNELVQFVERMSLE
jgi:chromosome segregation protein